MSRGYALITPVKNEEDTLPDFVDTICNQTVKPVVWMIIDDGSSDGTVEEIQCATNKHHWIRATKLHRNEGGYGFENIIRAVNVGVNAISETENDYDFVVKADVDIELDVDYFENLMKTLDSNEELGVASGVLLEEQDIRADYPRGVVVYKRECFENVGGYIGHKTTLIKAKVKGWNWYVDNNLLQLHKRSSDERKVSSARGRHVYRAGHSFFTSLFYTAYYSVSSSPKEAVDFLCGYLKNRFKGIEIIDEDVQEYYRRMPRKLIKNALGKIPAILTGEKGFESLSKGIHDEITKETD